MTGYRYARRAEVSGASVYDHAPGAILLGSGLAYPPFLPDVVREATETARDRAGESLQYGPLTGLDDLRDAIAAFVAADGVVCGRLPARSRDTVRVGTVSLRRQPRRDQPG